jgi:hypothetical protein
MAKRVDGNQKEIVHLLREIGVSVLVMSNLGKGAPDLLIGIRDQNFLIELKNGKMALSGQQLTIAEQKFHDEWRGQVCILNSREQVLEFVDRILNKR